jgi:hypothetical protein
VLFNVTIALILMEANMFDCLNTILGFYANCAMAWIVTVATDIAALPRLPPGLRAPGRCRLPHPQRVRLLAMPEHGAGRRSRAPRPAGAHEPVIAAANSALLYKAAWVCCPTSRR